MAEPVIISWTPANWITVVLMVVLMYALVGVGVKILKEQKAQKAAA